MADVIIERAYRITVGAQVLVLNDDEARDVIDGLGFMCNESAISGAEVDADDEESGMSLRKIKPKEKQQ